MAYHAGKLVSGIRLYPAGGKSPGEWKDDPQSADCLGSHGTLAWRGLEFCALGHRLFSAPFAGEENLWQMAGEKQSIGTSLHDSPDSHYLGDLCHHRYGTACGVSGQYGRLSSRGGPGGNHTTCAVSERIWRFIDSVCYFCNAPAREIVLYMEGSLVYGLDPSGGVLVFGEGDPCWGQ